MIMSLGIALRDIGGGQRVQVVTRVADANLLQYQKPGQEPEAAVAQQLFSFHAVSFREVGEGSDVWEFRVMEATPGGPVAAYVYVVGSDVLWIKRLAQVDVGLG